MGEVSINDFLKFFRIEINPAVVKVCESVVPDVLVYGLDNFERSLVGDDLVELVEVGLDGTQPDSSETNIEEPLEPRVVRVLLVGEVVPADRDGSSHLPREAFGNTDELVGLLLGDQAGTISSFVLDLDVVLEVFRELQGLLITLGDSKVTVRVRFNFYSDYIKSVLSEPV